MRGTEADIMKALGLEGRWIRRMQITFTAGHVPEVVIEEDLPALLNDSGEITSVLSRYELIPNPEDPA